MVKNDPEDNGDSITSAGFYTHTGYFVQPEKPEVSARYSMLDPNEVLQDDVQTEYTVGVNYYYMRGYRQQIRADVSSFVTEKEKNEKQV